jgi:hypothetical protein
MVLIEWDDAICMGSSGWNDPSDLEVWAREVPPRMYSVGFVVHSTKDWVVVVDSIGPHEVGCANKIPTQWIRGMYTLKAQTERIDIHGESPDNR